MFRSALYDYDEQSLVKVVEQLFADDAVLNYAWPVETLEPGSHNLVTQLYAPLQHAIPDLERRDYIVIAGEAQGSDWVGCAGYYTGVFEAPWLDIPPTGHVVAMRFHEFYRFVDGKIVEVQALWDLPELMMQAAAWPMAPSLAVEWLVPGPATQDGLQQSSTAGSNTGTSLKLVEDMLNGLSKHATGGVKAMQLEQYWHPHMNWYGPAGIGTSRRISGFRHWHQVPFLNALPNRQAHVAKGYHFADGNYTGFTAWPGMQATVSGDGWLGIAPAGQEITMRSLDFWRCENGLIRENWVLVDLLDIYQQLGVDVFARMRELTAHRQTAGK